MQQQQRRALAKHKLTVDILKDESTFAEQYEKLKEFLTDRTGGTEDGNGGRRCRSNGIQL